MRGVPRVLPIVMVTLAISCTGLVSGCVGSPAPSTSVITIGPSDVPATSTPSDSASNPSSPNPSSPNPSSTVPSAPPTAGALNVAKFTVVDFASPSGGIWCGMAYDYALCHIPFDGFAGKVPTTKEICPDEQLDVTGVNITSEGVAWFCSGDPSTMPDKGSDQVKWHKNTGFPFVKYSGHTLATLPYGTSLVRGDLICGSERSGMTCADLSTKHGFRVARSGIVLF